MKGSHYYLFQVSSPSHIHLETRILLFKTVHPDQNSQ